MERNEITLGYERHKKGGFRALDPDLPLLAARAAVQLDRLIIKGSTGNEPMDALKELSAMLSGVRMKAQGGGCEKELLDPFSVTILNRALVKSSPEQPIKSESDFIEATQTLAKSLDTPSDNSLDVLKNIRNFCIHLSNYSSAQRQIAFSGNPKPSYIR